MFGFLIKKTFFDMWDNFFIIILLNLGFIVILGACFGSFLGLLNFAVLIMSDNSMLLNMALYFLILFILTGIVSLYTGAACGIVKDISDYKQPGFKDFVKYLHKTYKSSLLFALLNSIIFFFLFIAIDYYLKILNTTLGSIAFFFIFWLYIFWITSSQYFFPLQSRCDTMFGKNIRKMLFLFFDNTAFSFFGILFGSIIILIISIFTLLLLPGPAAILLLHNTALKLRLYKYDYLDAHENKDNMQNKMEIPWDTLLAEDMKQVGKRTLKGTIFPTKE